MHAQCVHLVAVDDLAVQLVLDRQLLCRFGEMAGRTHIGWQIGKILGQIESLADCLTLDQGSLGGGEFVPPVDDEGQLAQRPAHLVLLALELVEAIDRLVRDDHRLSHTPRRTASPDGGVGQEDRPVERSRFIQRAYRHTDGVSELLVAELLLLAESNQQHPVAQGTGNVVQQQGGTCLALHVAASDDVRQMVPGCIVEDFAGQRQLPRFEDADHDTGTALLLRAATFYAKFHRPPPRQARAGSEKHRLSLQYFSKVKE